MQRSWPRVRTSPPASSSRNLAGRMILPFSSRRGECVPRNTSHRPSAVRSRTTTPALPLPSYALHFTPLLPTVNATRAVPCCWDKHVSAEWRGFCLGVESGGKFGRSAYRGRGGLQAWEHPLGGAVPRLKRNDPPQRVIPGLLAPNPGLDPVVHCGGWCEVEVAGSGARAQDSPRRLSSHRSSRLFIKELLFFDFRPCPPAFALPAATLRIVAK
jgi:hypothetical protein